jgi:hypothetical protein
MSKDVLLGVVPVVVVVVIVPVGISHRWPVYIGGQIQYGVFPFIWQKPPERQYPEAQVASKY